MLNVENVSVRHGRQRTLQDISLSLAPGRTLAVVGESGAGKSTLIAAVLGLVKLAQGQITWASAPVKDCRPALVMQEPRAAFNPARTLRQSVMEPLIGQDQPLAVERLDRLCRGLELPVDILNRRPDAVSIGQAQRVGILRALIAAPPLVLFDEPLSALDAVTQKQTARLIAEMQVEEKFSALIATHDLGFAVAHADEIAVIRAGRIEEITTPRGFVERPRTEYGHRLRDAAFALGALERVA